MLAYYLLARPVLDPSNPTTMLGASDPTKIMEDYSRNSGYLVSLSQAVGRIILAGRDLTRFAGYTSRVAELFNVLHDVNAGRYESTMVSKDDGENERATAKVVTSNDLHGTVECKDGVIEFINVPIVTPNGDRLVESLSLKVESGMNCLITGPNGCGKVRSNVYLTCFITYSHCSLSLPYLESLGIYGPFSVEKWSSLNQKLCFMFLKSHTLPWEPFGTRSCIQFVHSHFKHK
jgi:ABC-type multidrug transport system fused ATPase/permease subunit